MKRASASERHRRLFWRRMVTHFLISMAILGVSLGIGILGMNIMRIYPGGMRS